jgi:hypothetical protein
MPGILYGLREFVAGDVLVITYAVSDHGTKDDAAGTELVVSVFVIDDGACCTVVVGSKDHVFAFFVRSLEGIDVPVGKVLNGHVDDVVSQKIVESVLLLDIVSVVNNRENVVIESPAGDIRQLILSDI